MDKEALHFRAQSHEQFINWKFSSFVFFQHLNAIIYLLFIVAILSFSSCAFLKKKKTYNTQIFLLYADIESYDAILKVGKSE